jgi:hypothetical protein
MRHFMPLTVTPGSFGMRNTASEATLITPSGLPQRARTRRL